MHQPIHYWKCTSKLSLELHFSWWQENFSSSSPPILFKLFSLFLVFRKTPDPYPYPQHFQIISAIFKRQFSCLRCTDPESKCCQTDGQFHGGKKKKTIIPCNVLELWSSSNLFMKVRFHLKCTSRRKENNLKTLVDKQRKGKRLESTKLFQPVVL